MSDLIERLEVAAQWDDSPSSLIHEAIARIAALEAQLAKALSRTGAVKVKALEWTEYETDGWADRADAEAGSFGVFYNIDIQTDGYRVVFDHEAVGAIGTFETLDEAEAAAQADYERRILSALDPAAPEGQQEPVAESLELSGNTGELIDKMAEAIRDWGSHYDDGPWETLPDDRKAGWRGDAERALAVVKEYLTARRPSEQAVTEAMVGALKEARSVIYDTQQACLFDDDDGQIGVTEDAVISSHHFQKLCRALGAVDNALKAAMETGG